MSEKDISKIIVDFYERLSSWEDSVLKNHGLTPAQADTLEIVGTCGSIKMKDLAKKKKITKCTLTVAIKRLEKKELLLRKSHTKDRRISLIELTDKGRNCFAQFHKSHNRMSRKIVSGLTSTEQILFANMLEKVLNQI